MNEDLLIPVLVGLVLIVTVAFFVCVKDAISVVIDDHDPVEDAQEGEARPTRKDAEKDDVVSSLTPDGILVGLDDSIRAKENAQSMQRDRLFRAANSEWVKGNREYEMSLNSAGRLDILTALLRQDGPAKRSDLNLPMSDSVFHRHTMRLRQTGLLVSHGAGKGMRYSIHSSHTERLFELLLAVNEVNLQSASFISDNPRFATF